MQGQLREHTLAELIHEISTNDLSGVVRVERERVKAAVYAHVGKIVLASSNLRATRLVECLRRWNTFDAARWQKAESLLALPAAKTDAGFADLLVRHDVIDANALRRLRTRQTEEVLRPLLAWRDGAWAFEARVRIAEEERFAIDAPPLLIEAARATPEEFIARRFPESTEIIRPARDHKAIRNDDRTHNLIELLPAEAFMLSRVDGAISVGDLLQISAFPLAQAHAALYALVLGGLLTRDGVTRAFTPEAVARRRDTRAANSVMVDSAAEGRARQSIEETDAEKIKALFARGDAANLYAVLGVSRSAPPDRIKAAYYALAKRFHPDVFDRSQTTPELRSRIENAFAVITNAYDTLHSSESRAKYDLHALNSNASATAAPPPAPPPETKEAEQESGTAPPPSAQASAPAYRAEEAFQEGLRAEKVDNHVLALTRLGEAARLAPQQARYRAHYGRALARDRAKRHEAEAELLAAVSLAAGDASLRIMLAEFYRDVGLHRRAVGEVERILNSHPNDARARTLLKELRRGA